jgi:hypothetical protein
VVADKEGPYYELLCWKAGFYKLSPVELGSYEVAID